MAMVLLLKTNYMEKIKFHLDVKQTVWVREFHEVEFKSKEDLKQKLKELLTKEDFTIYDLDNEFNSFIEQTIQSDTLDCMSVQENDGCSTIEVYMDDEIIAQNGE
jgi:hypothetical protein